MNIPTTVDTYLRHVATGGQKTFLAPGLSLSGAPYTLVGEHEVLINGAATTNPWTYDSGTGVITFTNGLTADDVVEIWRRTEVNESLVSFPVATSWTPKHNNKSITQLLMLIQELWGGLKEANVDLQVAIEETRDYIDAAVTSLTSYVNSAVSNLQTWVTNTVSAAVADLEAQLLALSSATTAALSALDTSLKTYTNNAIAAVCGTGAISGSTIWSTTISAGVTEIQTPLAFDRGILIAGGVTYNLSNPAHATLSWVGNARKITLTSAPGACEAILVVFELSRTVSSVWSTTLAAGTTDVLTPYLFTKGFMIVGGVTYDVSNSSHVTLIHGTTTTVRILSAFPGDQEVILVTL